MGWEATSKDRRTTSATLLLKPVTNKGCSRGAVPSPETPALLLSMDKTDQRGVWCHFTSPAPTRLTGWPIPAEDQRPIQLTRSSLSLCTHPAAPLVIFTSLPSPPRVGWEGT